VTARDEIPPDVSVVVVSWQTRVLTVACLSSVLGGGCGQRTFELVLVDNGSDDGTAEAVAAAFPEVRVIALGRNAGFAAAANRGIAESTGRYVLLLNSDAELPRDAGGVLAEHLDANADVAAVGARLAGSDGRPQFSCGRFLSPVNQFAESIGITRLLPFRSLRRSYTPAELAPPVVEVDWCVGACLMLRRTALEDTGPFDERFFMYSEDEDLCMRLRKSGWSIVLLSDVRIPHAGGASAARALARMRGAAFESQNAFMLKHFGRVRAWTFRALMQLARLKPRRDEHGVGWGR